MHTTTSPRLSSVLAASAPATVLRVVVGGLVVVHGTQKLLGWFGGAGIRATSKRMTALGFRPGVTHALGAGIGETGAGAALILGLGTPAAGAITAIARAMSASVRARNGLPAAEDGPEHAALLGLAALTFTIAGPGPLSLDAATGHLLDRPWMRGTAAALIPLVVAVEVRRRTEILSRDRGASVEAGA